jgi:hypothetical protein
MTTKEHFDNILNICLDRMLKGESIEQCLASYPEQARDLEPLLRTARAARVASTVRPRAEFKARARAEFQAALREAETRQASRLSFLSWRWEWHSAWGVAIVAVLLVIATLGGTVTAAAGSMPGSALYPVKMATENVQLAFTFSEAGKANLNSVLAAKRVDEIAYMASRGNVQQVEVTAMRLNNNLAEISNILGIEKNILTGPTADASIQKTAPSREAAPPPLALVPETTMAAGAAPSMTVAAGAAPTTTAATGTMPARPGPVPATVGPDSGVFGGSASPPANIIEQDPRTNTPYKIASPANANQGILNNTQGQPARLEDALKQAPAEVRPALEQAINKAVAEYELLNQALNQATD